ARGGGLAGRWAARRPTPSDAASSGAAAPEPLAPRSSRALPLALAPLGLVAGRGLPSAFAALVFGVFGGGLVVALLVVAHVHVDARHRELLALGDAGLDVLRRRDLEQPVVGPRA